MYYYYIFSSVITFFRISSSFFLPKLENNLSTPVPKALSLFLLRSLSQMHASILLLFPELVADWLLGCLVALKICHMAVAPAFPLTVLLDLDTLFIESHSFPLVPPLHGVHAQVTY